MQRILYCIHFVVVTGTVIIFYDADQSIFSAVGRRIGHLIDDIISRIDRADIAVVNAMVHDFCVAFAEGIIVFLSVNRSVCPRNDVFLIGRVAGSQDED